MEQQQKQVRIWQKCKARDMFTLATLSGLWYSGEELCPAVEGESRDHWSLANAESIFQAWDGKQTQLTGQTKL